MRVNWVEWLPKYYPKYNSELFGRCLRKVGEWGIPEEEFSYIVLGCGYLFYVRRLNEENEFRRVKQDLGRKLGNKAVGFLLNDKAVRKKIRKWGLVIGPEERPLTSSNKRGPPPRPTTRIADLTIDNWLKGRLSEQILNNLICWMHEALSGERILVSTYIRIRQKAEGVKVEIHTPSRRDVPAINRLVVMLENRYKKYKEEYKDMDYTIKDISEFYRIKGITDEVLKAVGVTLPRA